MKLRRAWFTSIFVVIVLSTAALWAESDPPGRVARLQYMSGSVSIQPLGTEEWVAGNLNRPLTTSDNIWTDTDARAELNLGYATVRLSSETSLTLTNVNDSTVQMELHQGSLNLRVQRLYKGEIYEVDTPNMAFTIQKAGRYRFDVGPNGDASLVTVWEGQGDATGDGRSVRVKSHERARFSNGTSLAHEVYAAPSPDGFDDWCLVRDRRQDDSYSARYVSPGVIGYEDLDTYGSWRTLPTYGPVWVPTVVSAGWAPYRYGHWVWVSPWGWTWVDDAPWGFAPFHYGRWIYANDYWAWAPGPIYARPVYAPALVAWFGGPSFGIGLFAGGGYGWCPLGYGEPYIPWYGGSRRYFRNVNITNTRITNITYITNNYYGRKTWPNGNGIQYANLRAPGGMIAAPHRAIVDSQPIGRIATPVPAKDAAAFARNSLGNRLDLTPTRESRLGSNAGRPAIGAPRQVMERPVVNRMKPPTPVAPRPVIADKQIDHAQPGRVADNQSLARPAPERFVPRPPQRGGAVADRTGNKASSELPAGGVPEVRATRPGVREVPRPPVTARGFDDRPNVSQPASQPSRDRSPALAESVNDRPVPRPPANARRDDGTAAPAMPQSQESPRHLSNPSYSVPRPSGPVAPAKGMGPDERVPRVSSPGEGSVPRGMGPDERTPRTAPPAMSSPGRDIGGPPPRSYGESPRYSQPAPQRSAPPQSAPHESAPRSAPAPATHGPSGGGSEGHAPHNR